jgi:glycosyltransferase involved in cell wall biosynthesis
MVAAAAAGTGFSFTAHAGDIDEDNLIVHKSTRASLLRVISRDGQRRVHEAGVSPSVIRLVRLGVDVPNRPVSRPRLRGHLQVMVPAALHRKKGHVDLLWALRQLNFSSPTVDVRLHLAGSGPLEEDLRRLSRELGVADKVTFLGQLPHETLLARYREGAVDVVALASVTRGAQEAEGIPVSLIEGMAHGIPVVATDSGGVPELVDETTGILVAMRDPVGLAAAFRSLALDPELGDRLGAAGRARIQAGYDVHQTAAELVAAISPSTLETVSERTSKIPRPGRY